MEGISIVIFSFLNFSEIPSQWFHWYIYSTTLFFAIYYHFTLQHWFCSLSKYCSSIYDRNLEVHLFKICVVFSFEIKIHLRRERRSLACNFLNFKLIVIVIKNMLIVLLKWKCSILNCCDFKIKQYKGIGNEVIHL